MISVEPFARKHVKDAARLFASSYEKQRMTIGCLPPDYDKLDTIVHLLEGILAKHPGVVAISGGKLAGYLTGLAGIPNFKGVSSGVYVPEWAHAAANDPEKGRVFQSMYGAISQRWVRSGCFTHAVTFFASNERLRNLLYWNGFGLLVVDAIRAIGRDDLNRYNEEELDSEIVIRRATVDDVGELARLDNELVAYLSRSPTFLFTANKESETPEALIGENVISIIAERGRQVLACIRGKVRKENGCTIVQSESVMGIDFAYTEPGVRGMGIGKRILGQILEWGRSKQKVGCAVDFESANVLGRVFWLKHFVPVCFSAIRHVDPRVR